jgi:hypothetical protein
MAQVPPPFSLTPAYQTQNQVLNYQEKRDAETYYKGCLPLEGDPYDGNYLKDVTIILIHYLARVIVEIKG